MHDRLRQSQVWMMDNSRAAVFALMQQQRIKPCTDARTIGVQKILLVPEEHAGIQVRGHIDVGNVDEVLQSAPAPFSGELTEDAAGLVDADQLGEERFELQGFLELCLLRPRESVGNLVGI